MQRSLWVLIICCLPAFSSAQRTAIITDPPLPRLKDCHMVIRTRELFPFPNTNQKVLARDTDYVFLIGPDGWVTGRLKASGGRCLGEEKLRVENGKITKREWFSSIDIHPVFARINEHRHEFSSSDSFEYQNGKLYREWNFACGDKALTKLTTYEYDEQGRVANLSFEFPKQTCVLYKEQFDAVRIDYSSDSIIHWRYKQGHIVDSLKYEAHYKNGKQIQWRFATTDGVQEEGRRRFDSSGNLVLDEWISNMPSVQGGRIYQPDRIEFTYDKQGRPVEIKCSIRGLRCWAYYYSYLR
jgi:hypothetical protein